MQNYQRWKYLKCLIFPEVTNFSVTWIHFVSNMYLFLFHHQKVPLHIAAGEGHLDVVQYLVEEKRAYVNIKDMYGVCI